MTYKFLFGVMFKQILNIISNFLTGSNGCTIRSVILLAANGQNKSNYLVYLDDGQHYTNLSPRYHC